jgi:hypothetical protein
MSPLTHDQLVQHIYALHQTLLDVERNSPARHLMRRCVLDSMSRHHHTQPPADFATTLLPIAYSTYTTKIPGVQS